MMIGLGIGRILCALAAVWASSGAGAEAQQRSTGVEATAGPLDAAARMALVVGNARYSHAEPLRNPINDAVAVADALQGLGFDVTRVLDASHEVMDSAIMKFGRRLRAGDVALFYYAGHGLQVDNENYLVPMDADIEDEAQVKERAVSAESVLDAMAKAKGGLRIMVLDACRNNPYEARGWRGPRNGTGGLAAITAEGRTLIAYSTAANAVADDGDGVNSPYTEELLRHIREPLPVGTMFARVKNAVYERTGWRQAPFISSGPMLGFSLVTGLEPDSTAERGPSALERRRPGRLFRDCGTCPGMVVLPQGSYMMGSPISEEGRYDNESPAHRVTIGYSLAVGVYEVTFAEWDACAAAGGCGGYRPDDEGWGRGGRPVINASWEHAREYVRWLSEKTGEEYRLPSESEWEYAARGGSATARHWGESESGQCRYGNGYDWTIEAEIELDEITVAACADGHQAPAPVGMYEPNRFGLHDMLGNVWEWTEDCWNRNYTGAPVDGSAWRSGDCSRHVARGGSWHDPPRVLRSATRVGPPTAHVDDRLGFRVARTIH